MSVCGFPIEHHLRTRKARVKIELPLDMCHRVLVTAARTLGPPNLFFRTHTLNRMVEFYQIRNYMYLGTDCLTKRNYSMECLIMVIEFYCPSNGIMRSKYTVSSETHYSAAEHYLLISAMLLYHKIVMWSRHSQ